MPINKCRRMIEDLKRDYKSRPIEAHPEFSNFVRRDQCRQMLDNIKRKNQLNGIEAHPDFNKFVSKEQCQQTLHSQIRAERQKTLDKYACYDGATYRKGTCERPKTIADFDIKEHPDFGKYIPKTEVSTMMMSKVRRLNDQYNHRPIEQHPDYAKLKSYFAGVLRDKMTQLKSGIESQPIERHRDYKRVMDVYACSEGEGDARRYVPCPSCKPRVKLSDFDINEHPDIDKYILKDEAKKVSQQLVDSIKQRYGFYCRQSGQFKPCNTQPKCKLTDHPEMEDYVKRVEYQQLANKLEQLREKYVKVKNKQKQLVKDAAKSKDKGREVVENGGDTVIRPNGVQGSDTVQRVRPLYSDTPVSSGNPVMDTDRFQSAYF